jgi:hypothetical protein
MKTVVAAGAGLGGLVTAVADAGWYALAGLGLLLLSGLVVVCWVITNRARTLNAVALITAARGQPDVPPASAPDPAAEP